MYFSCLFLYSLYSLQYTVLEGCSSQCSHGSFTVQQMFQLERTKSQQISKKINKFKKKSYCMGPELFGQHGYVAISTMSKLYLKLCQARSFDLI